jgi:hypothetical protein
MIPFLPVWVVIAFLSVYNAIKLPYLLNAAKYPVYHVSEPLVCCAYISHAGNVGDVSLFIVDAHTPTHTQGGDLPLTAPRWWVIPHVFIMLISNTLGLYYAFAVVGSFGSFCFPYALKHHTYVTT